MAKYIMKSYLPALLSAAILMMVALLAASPALAQDGLGLETEPGAIDMGLFYNGIDLTVTGHVLAGDELVLHFTGEPSEVHLREKGKALGLLWMNMGPVSLDNVPRVFIVQASKPLTDLGQAGKDLSLQGLHDSITVEQAGTQGIDTSSELIKLKEQEDLYTEGYGDVEFGPEQDGLRPFTATLHVPSRLSTGEYLVEAYALRDGAIEASQSLPIKAQLVGIPAWLAAMAFDNGTLYGILAVVIAILAGLAIGLVFQSKGAH